MVKNNGQMYKFVVDCNAKHCDEIRDYMSKQGFAVRTKDTWMGDHYGVKRFETERKAEAEADRLFKKYSKGRKMHRVTIVPPE